MGEQVARQVLEPLLSVQGILTLLGVGALLLIPVVGEVVLVGLIGLAIYDLLVRVTALFKAYYEKAVGAKTWAELWAAGKTFAQAVAAGLLDVLAVFGGGSALLSRLRALRALGPLTFRMWVGLVAEQAQLLWSRLRGGIKNFADFVREQQQKLQKPQPNKPQALPRTPRPMNALTDPQAMLDEALYRQGKKSGDPYPGGLKEPQKGGTWSENGYDYEVRVHQPPANAPAGSNSANGPTYRVMRRKQGVDPSNGTNQGYGLEYIDDQGVWHKQSDLKKGIPPGASNSTHIPLPNGTIK